MSAVQGSACPTWCTDHSIDVSLNYHRGYLGDELKLQIGQDISFDGSGDSPFHSPYIADDQPFELSNLNPSEIREFAALLLVTADLMEVSA